MPVSVPILTSALFLATFILNYILLLKAVKKVINYSTANSKIAKMFPYIFLSWIVFVSTLATTDFYADISFVPPKLFLFGVFPSLLAIVYTLFNDRKSKWLDNVTVESLLWINVIRIPVEICLHQLYLNGAVPQEMTFEGRNFDIVSGVTAVLMIVLLRKNKIKRYHLILWNVFCLALLLNIVTTAILSLPYPFQKFGLSQPNIAVLHFPFALLPAVIVPVVFFSHCAMLMKLWREK